MSHELKEARGTIDMTTATFELKPHPVEQELC